MTTLAAVLAGFPNPVTWTVDKVQGFVSGAATAGIEAVIGGLVAWVIDAVVWVVGGVFNFFLDATDPNVEADWFVHGSGANRVGPYLLTATVAAVLLVGFLLIGIIQGVLSGDVAGMLHRMVLHAPAAVLGMVGLIGGTQALIRLTDSLSTWVLTSFQEDISRFSSALTSLTLLHGSTATAFVVFLLGLLTVIAGLAVVAELVVRAALVYLVVALAPFAFAVLVWPALRGTTKRTLELLVALILSKLVIAVALATAAAALAGVGGGGQLASGALPPPGAGPKDPNGSVTQAVGILLAGLAGFGVAAFSPLLITRLLPFTEAAAVATGLKGAPVRAGQQLMSAGTSVALMKARVPLAVAEPLIGVGTPGTAPRRDGAAAGRGRATAALPEGGASSRPPPALGPGRASSGDTGRRPPRALPPGSSRD